MQLSKGKVLWAKGPTASAKPRGIRALGGLKRDRGARVVGVNEVEMRLHNKSRPDYKGSCKSWLRHAPFLNEIKFPEATVVTHVLGN